jgi:hypothetical protein
MPALPLPAGEFVRETPVFLPETDRSNSSRRVVASRRRFATTTARSRSSSGHAWIEQHVWVLEHHLPRLTPKRIAPRSA